jgi:hypothetical protein
MCFSEKTAEAVRLCTVNASSLLNALEPPESCLLLSVILANLFFFFYLCILVY